MLPRHTLPILGALAMLAACGDDAEKIDAERPTISFFVERDSLSDSAHVRRLVPEPDSRSIAIVFADPGLGIEAGLALLEPELQRVRLVWPDSVGSVWWSGDHRLAFESHTGATHVRAVVDVHADSLEQLRISADSLPAAGPAAPADDAVRARATAYIDSVRGQPGGVPQDGSLRYTVTALSTAPSDSLVAFYVSARARGDEALNPSWYILHVPSGRIAPVDSVTGRAEALRADAAAWSGDRFVFARGDVLYEARIATNSLQ